MNYLTFAFNNLWSSYTFQTSTEDVVQRFINAISLTGNVASDAFTFNINRKCRRGVASLTSLLSQQIRLGRREVRTLHFGAILLCFRRFTDFSSCFSQFVFCQRLLQDGEGFF